MHNHTPSTRQKNGRAHMFPKSCSSHVIVHYCELIFEELVIGCVYELLLWVFSLGTLFVGCNCEQGVHFLRILFFMCYCELLRVVSSFFENLAYQVLLWTGSSVFRHFMEQISYRIGSSMWAKFNRIPKLSYLPLLQVTTYEMSRSRCD
jgi:hypothetical protein